MSLHISPKMWSGYTVCGYSYVIIYIPVAKLFMEILKFSFKICLVDSTPSQRDLQLYFTPQYAVQWRVIGTQLGLPSGALDIIEHDNHYKAKECCNAMLRKWLQVDTTASWSKLFTVIESPAVSCSAPDKGDKL